MTSRFMRTWAKSFSMLSRLRVRLKVRRLRVKGKKEKEKSQEGAEEYVGDRGIWVDNEKCSCHLLEQISASERDFKITFTRADSAGGRSHSVWKFHFHNLQDGSLSLDVSQEYILSSFPEHDDGECRWMEANFYRIIWRYADSSRYATDNEFHFNIIYI